MIAMALETQENLGELADQDLGVCKVSADELSTGDLAELMAAFTEVTAKLEKTHGQLRAEVSRLNAELHQANEALQRSRRLAALGEMAAGISHEIRNPLGSIRLYTNMLIEDLADLPEQQQVVEKIGRAVRGLDEIVGDVLTFAREMKIHPHLCGTSALIDAAFEMCCADMRSMQIFRQDLETDSFEIVCDPILIQQALVNILRNAAQANLTSNGRQIAVSVEPCKLQGAEQQVEGYIFSIRDQGDGIPQQVIERMFNPFFTTRATGTGLGLAIVHRIIDAHRGKVEVRNNGSDGQGQTVGASVELYLPKVQPVVVSQGSRGVGDAEIVVKPQHQAVHIHGVS